MRAKTKASMTVEKMQIPSFGRKELDVKQDSLDAGISGNNRCFHFGFLELTTNGTPPDTVIVAWADKTVQPSAGCDES